MPYPISAVRSKLSGRIEINRVCPAITPTLGSEILTDPGLEAWASATNLTSWTETLAGTSTVNQEATVVHGGSNAARLDVDGSNSNVSFSQSKTLVVGTWYQISTWARRGVTSGNLNIVLGLVFDRNYTLTTSFAQYFGTVRAGATSTALALARSVAAGASLYCDDVSVKALTFSTCLTYLGNIGHKSGTYQCAPTVTSGTVSGLVFNYLDVNNFSVIWVDGVNAKLESRIAGTWTTVKTGAITYGATKILKAFVNGTTVKLYYDGTQVSTDGTIDNSGLGTQVWGFNTYAGNLVGTVTTSKATS